jgi:hypothetical protein
MMLKPVRQIIGLFQGFAVLSGRSGLSWRRAAAPHFGATTAPSELTHTCLEKNMSSNSPSGGGFGAVLRVLGRILAIVAVIVAVVAIRLFRASDPGDFMVIGLGLFALLALGFLVLSVVNDVRSQKPSVPLAIGKLVLSLLAGIVALFSVSALWGDGSIADTPVGLVRFGYLGGSTAFGSSALLGLSIVGLASALLAFTGQRLGWLRGLGLWLVVTVGGGLLGPVVSGWHYRQLEASEWSKLAGSTDTFDWSGYGVDVPEAFQRPEYEVGYTWAYINEGLHGNTALLRNTLNQMQLTPAQAAVPDWDRIIRAIIAWLPTAPNPETAREIEQALEGALDRNPFPPAIVALKQQAKASLPASKG